MKFNFIADVFYRNRLLTTDFDVHRNLMKFIIEFVLKIKILKNDFRLNKIWGNFLKEFRV